MFEDNECPSYHKKLANMNNVKEKINLKKIEKKFEKMKNDKVAGYNRDEKELRSHLQRLTLEQQESRRELGDVRSFLREMKEADDHQTSAMRRGSMAKMGVDKILKRASAATVKVEPQEEIFSPIDAHQVALRLLEHQFAKDVPKRSRPGATSSSQPADASHLTQRSDPTGVHRRPSKDALGQTSAPRIGSSKAKENTSVGLSHDSLDTSKEEDDLLSSDDVAKSAWLQARKIGKSQSDVVSRISSPKMTLLRKTGTTLDMSVPDESEEEEQQDRTDLEALQKYYELMNDKDKPHEREAESSPGLHGTMSTYKRSQRRKVLALEALLKQLPSFQRKSQIPLSHKDALDCRYLRMPQSTIRELEALCRQEGIEPGLHSHMTEEDVLAYLDGRPLPGSSSAPFPSSVRSSMHSSFKPSFNTPSHSSMSGKTSGSTAKVKVSSTKGRALGSGRKF